MKATNSVAINKPRLILGMDKRALALGFIVAGLCVEVHQKIVGEVAFVAFIWLGTRLAKRDPKFIEIVTGLVRQKGLYDPSKRSLPKLVIQRGAHAKS